MRAGENREACVEGKKRRYELAKAQYAALGVDTDKVIEKMSEVAISLHCWQTDDVGGFEAPDAELGGGGGYR